MGCTVVLNNGWPLRCTEDELAFNLHEETVIVRGVSYHQDQVASITTPYFEVQNEN